jgi:chromosome segregation ATPase
MAGNRELEKDNEQRIEGNKQLTYNVNLILNQIKHLRDEKTKLESECERLTTQLDNNISALKQAEKEARNLEGMNTKLDNTLAQAERDNQRLLQEVKARETSSAKTEAHLEDLNEKSEDLKAKTKQIEAECARLEA